MYINLSMNIREIITKYPETKAVFENQGIQGLEDEKVLQLLEAYPLSKIMELKKVDSKAFLSRLEESIKTNRETSDITMKKEEKKENGLSLLGLLPCPVRIPLLEGFQNFLQNHPDVEVNYELKAASSGLDWLKKDVIEANHVDQLADMFLSAGFDLFFDNKWMGKWKAEGIFEDMTGLTHYNTDFENENISLKDPKGDYSMIGVVPAIFLVNKNALGNRKAPESWQDILSEEFENSISLPIADFDLFNSILVHIYKLYGQEGVEKLGKSLLSNLHPAQMVDAKEPAITIMPFFFSKMIKENGPMQVVWPKEGAIISPIFMLTKKHRKEELKPIVNFMGGKEVGTIISHQGLFPSIHPEVENPTSGKPFVWIGWDFIYSHDMGQLLQDCESWFMKGAKRS
ncbi:ABC transporter substrate-binding protein [Fusobacterium gonidiaformans]|uniref:ABC transporter substrate-binding protein n=1 Tax=Fusobacterium gonidiaformans TaxID=849 RepID=UPI0001BC6792|nr:ABC transporter substrate-binding protein [Fusobacterium gonidiaformans]AVQ16316.1 spermidine/putrescine ABC transporter substrate-binding protein [Fusobacterium gonidiaformans ATCC 25563]EFS28886.2 hypothetical protein FGAG_01207 [Fusobacterium gonidiaformans ATCC 25563]